MNEPGVPCECPHCGNGFEVRKSLAGGITNCPRCDKAVEVTSMRDPAWRLLQVGAILAIGFVGWFVNERAGSNTAVLSVAGLSLALWIVSRLL